VREEERKGMKEINEKKRENIARKENARFKNK
jgi:hypothetical protein